MVWSDPEREAFEVVKLLILDVDGVLTDGRILMGLKGEAIYGFHVRDGQGLRLLLKAGIDVVLVSGRVSAAAGRRATELGIREVHQGVEDKGGLCREIIRKRGLRREEVCCVGDDLPDLSLFREVGVPVAVADAAPEVLEAARFHTERNGGAGAVREVCEWILKARGAWTDLISTLRDKG